GAGGTTTGTRSRSRRGLLDDRSGNGLGSSRGLHNRNLGSLSRRSGHGAGGTTTGTRSRSRRGLLDDRSGNGLGS
ncbi:hypothetical protein, partial [Streptomyces sp. IGB124]|uniref:hypothetical protein n=1 Tax=Streptomyces sp. IGB124 TaxID=1519485 RepID=UPI0006BF355B